VEHWKRFFADHETYFKVGRVSHPPIDPSTPLPPHCEPKKDAEQNARWGVVGVPPPDHPAAAAAAAIVDDNDAKAAAGVVPDLDAKSGTKPHEELWSWRALSSGTFMPFESGLAVAATPRRFAFIWYLLFLPVNLILFM
jgi:hypothetical protein